MVRTQSSSPEGSTLSVRKKPQSYRQGLQAVGGLQQTKTEGKPDLAPPCECNQRQPLSESRGKGGDQREGFLVTWSESLWGELCPFYRPLSTQSPRLPWPGDNGQVSSDLLSVEAGL